MSPRVDVKSELPSGFFPRLYENVCKSLTSEDYAVLEGSRSDPSAFFRFAYEWPSLRQALQIREFYPEKNGDEAKIKREYGNKAYSEGRDLDALFYYTQAVIASPCDPKSGHSRDLSVSLANRSAVLFSLKAYSLALDDIRLALEVGYPAELRYKLLQRKAKILMHFRQFVDARECYKEVIKTLDLAKVDSKKKLTVQKDTQMALEALGKAKAVTNDTNVSMTFDQGGQIPDVPSRNAKYPAMTNHVQFRYEEGRGRFAVATDDISVGQVICVEKACVSHILPEYMSSNCAHCFRTMKAPLPCPTCSGVMYCSYSCRAEALSTYHPYECKFLDFFIASGMSIMGFMAYRAICQKPLSFFLENRNAFEHHDPTSGSKSGQIEKYLSDDYRNIYNLVTHSQERKLNDLFHRATFSVMLVKCLKRSGYFGPEACSDVDQLSEDECFIGLLITHFLEAFQFNTHEVAQYEMLVKNQEQGSKSVFIGGAVFPTLALFNHSCDPSIVRYYVRDVVVALTIKNIKKGEEICENYGPIFFHSAKADRQERLRKQYWFECRCIPCTENWPQMQDMDNRVLLFRCAVCSSGVPYETNSNTINLKCVCGTPLNLLMALKALSDTDHIGDAAKKELDAGNLEKAQDLYMQYMKALDDVLTPPYLDYYKVQQYIWKCIWMRHGNRVIKGKMTKAVTEAIAADLAGAFDSVD